MNIIMGRDIKPIKIAFPTIHNPSIGTEEGDCFRGFLDLLQQMNIRCTFPEQEIMIYEKIMAYDALVFTGPTGNRGIGPSHLFTPSEIDDLQKYLHQGGTILVLMRFGGDRLTKSNYCDIVPGLQSNDVSLIHTELNDRFVNEPLIQVDFEYENVSFKGKICYDSGCTFSSLDPVDLSMNFEEGSQIVPNPQGLRDYKRKALFKEAFGKILMLKEIDAGRIIYFGSRWSFSDKFITKYDNLQFLQSMIHLLLPNYFTKDLIRRMANNKT